jgi:hypothetical protein
MIVLDARLPYTRVKRLRGSPWRIVLRVPRTGVIPLPAAKPR